jgi:hypothetical protein
LLDEALNLARGGILGYDVALNMTRYTIATITAAVRHHVCSKICCTEYNKRQYLNIQDEIY